MTAPVALYDTTHHTPVQAGHASSLNFAKPSAIAKSNGLHMLWFSAFRNAAGTLTATGSFSQIGPTSTASIGQGLFKKYVPTGSAETATQYTVSNTGGVGSSRCAGDIICVSGADPAAFVNVAAAAVSTSSSSNSLGLATVTPTRNNCLLFAVLVASISGSTPVVFNASTSGMTILTQQGVYDSTVGSSLSVGIAAVTLGGSSSGIATGTKTFGMSATAGNAWGYLFAVAPPTGPTAAFSYAASGTSASFTNNSTAVLPATLTAASWDFGDGGTSAVASPNHVYAAPGTYTVTLTETDSNSATSTTTQDVVVTAPLTVAAVAQPGNFPPRVLLTVGHAAGASVTVTRIDSAGNRSPVRAAAPGQLSGGAWVGYDYEAPFQRPVTYEATDGSSTSSSSAVTVAVTQPWLIHPGIPSLSCPVIIASMGDETADVNQGIHRPLGRKAPIVITDGARQAPTFDMILRTEDEVDEGLLEDLLGDASTLLLQIAYDPAATTRTYYRWVSVGQVVKSRLVATFLSEYMHWTLPCTVSSRPSGTLQAQRTWTDVLGTYLTWNDVLGSYASWRDVITDVQDAPDQSPTPDPVPDPPPVPTPTSSIPAMPTVPAATSFTDRHPFTDFTLLSKRAGFVPGAVLAGTDLNTTDYYMVANSSTQASQVPPQSAVPATNPLYLLWKVGSATTVIPGISWHDFSLIATPQGHLYNGMMIGYADAPHLYSLFVQGVPGDSNAPPGETFSINLWHTTNALLEGCIVDGRDANGTPTAASLIGLNNATNTTLKFCRAQYSNSGMSFTAWQSSGTVMQDCDFSNSRRILNFEQCSGTADITRVNLSGQWSTSKHISCNGNLASVRMTITDPIVGTARPTDAGSEWPLRIMAGGANVPQYPPGSGKTNLQKQSDIKVIVTGVGDVTANPAYVKFL